MRSAASGVRSVESPHGRQVFEAGRAGDIGCRCGGDCQLGPRLEAPWPSETGARHAKGHRYPTEKPVALIERIVLAASSDGDLVADLLCGGGTVPFVAAKHGRRWIAGDPSPDAVEMTRLRLEGIGESADVVIR